MSMFRRFAHRIIPGVCFASKTAVPSASHHSSRGTDLFGREREYLRTLRIAASLWLILGTSSHGVCQLPLADKSMEELLKLKVTSVGKKAQSLSKTAAAVFVITESEIRMSGANSIPDLLRMVPGLDVAQINANEWAIGARGFNAQFENKLLVMLDGRSVYTPTFSGVFWDVLDVPLRDIERIEVVRGPGGTTWGANAVNGVVNIITKPAGATRGGSVSVSSGNESPANGTVQFGSKVGANTDYRMFGSARMINHLPGPSGSDAGDAWHILRGGFRMDSRLSPLSDLSVEGDIYSGREGDLIPHMPTSLQAGIMYSDLSGASLQSSWNHRYSSTSEINLESSVDQTRRNDVLREERTTVDTNFQHHFAWGERQDIVWGGEFRFSSASAEGSAIMKLSPLERDRTLFSSFVQDEITLSSALSVTLGTKLEHNSYTGFGLMPSIRAAYSLGKRQVIWAAVSRAIRTPADTDVGMNLNVANIVLPNGSPAVIRLTGNPDFGDEHLVAYELGYRMGISDRWSIDVASYWNSYRALKTSEPGIAFFEVAPSPAHLILPEVYHNLMHGVGRGGEIVTNWKANNRWTMTAGYAFENVVLSLEPASQDGAGLEAMEGSSPRHWVRVGSHLNLNRRMAWDISAAFTDRLLGLQVPSNTRLDTQLTWSAWEHVSISAVGQNLLRGRHGEFNDPNGSGPSSSIIRSAFLRCQWSF